MLSDTVDPWRESFGGAFEGAFHLISPFLSRKYLLRLIAAPGAPGANIALLGGCGSTGALSVRWDL